MSEYTKKYDETESGLTGQSGIIRDEPVETYHANEACISHSRLKVYADRPLRYKARFIDQTEPAPRSAAMDFGNVAHSLILEPDTYLDRYAIYPPAPDGMLLNMDGSPKRTSKEYKQWKTDVLDGWEKMHEGKRFVNAEDDRKARDMRDSVMSHAAASRLLRDGISEVTFRSEQLANGLRLQCRTDYWSPDGKYVSDGESYAVDLKTVDDLDSIEHTAAKLLYYRQAGFYRRVASLAGLVMPDMQTPFHRFYFIFVEKNAPHECAVVELQDSAIAQGANESGDDLRAISKAIRDEHWPSWAEHKRNHRFLACYRSELKEIDTRGIVKLDLPEWYYIKQAERADE